MSSHHPCNAVFPVVLVSSAVFSLLSLPFFLYRSQPEAASSSLHQDFQPVLESKNRDLTIRYIGAAMVASVITGIGTIELQRKVFTRQATVAFPLIGQNQNLTEFSSDQALEQLADALPSDIEFAAAEFDTEFNAEFDVEPAEPVAPFLPASLATKVGCLSHAADTHNNQPAPSTDLVSLQTEQELITELNQDYATCRIWVQHLHRRLLAIQVEGQFYSFFRLLPTEESARQIAFQLSETLNQTAITPVEQEFAVWVWQPEAELEAQPA